MLPGLLPQMMLGLWKRVSFNEKGASMLFVRKITIENIAPL